VFRYLGFILISVMGVGLTGAVGFVLVGGVAEAVTGHPMVYATAFDGIGTAGGHPPRIRAAFRGPSGSQPLDSAWFLVRFPEGWTRWVWVYPHGLAKTNGPQHLTAGTYRFTVGRPEIYPRLDVVAEATAWIWPAEAQVAWIDADALVPEEAAADLTGRPEPAPKAVREAIDALKTLAGACRPVYLVAEPPRKYAAVRRRLAAWGAPGGPAFWVIPERPSGRLKGLKGVWPTVAGAVLASDALADETEALGIAIHRVPPAGGSADTAASTDAWRRARDRLITKESASRNPRR